MRLNLVARESTLACGTVLRTYDSRTDATNSTFIRLGDSFSSSSRAISNLDSVSFPLHEFRIVPPFLFKTESACESAFLNRERSTSFEMANLPVFRSRGISDASEAEDTASKKSSTPFQDPLENFPESMAEISATMEWSSFDESRMATSSIRVFLNEVTTVSTCLFETPLSRRRSLASAESSEKRDKFQRLRRWGWDSRNPDNSAETSRSHLSGTSDDTDLKRSDTASSYARTSECSFVASMTARYFTESDFNPSMA